jgi:hypothetical protein
MRKKLAISIWVAACFSCTIGAFPGGADEPGICSSISLEGSAAFATERQMSDWDPLEKEVFGRIEQSSKIKPVTAPVSYSYGRDGMSLEVAGLACEQAKLHVREHILDGHIVELVVADDVLPINLTSVAEIGLGPNGNLQILLNSSGTKRLREMTRNHIDDDGVVKIAGVGVVERIPVLGEIESGLISLRGERLPRKLIEDRRLALPVTVGKCVQECSSGYSWFRDGVRYVYRP